MILRSFDEGTDFVLTTALTALEMIVCLCCFDAEIVVDYVLQDIPQVLYRNRFNQRFHVKGMTIIKKSKT
jgi:hypothetical protein